MAVTNATLTALVTMALLAMVQVYCRGRRSDYLLAGLLAGLAGSTKYNAVPVLLSFLLAHFAGRPRPAWMSTSAVVGLLAVPAGFFLGSPAILWNWRPFLEHVGWLSHFAADATPELTSERMSYVAGYAAESGFGLVGALVLGGALVAVLHRRRAIEWLLLVFVLGSIPLMTNNTLRWMPRNLVPLTPAAYVLAGGMLSIAVSVFQRRARLRPGYGAVFLGLVTVVMAAPQAREAVSWDRMMSQQDSRTAAYEWVVDHFPPGTVVATDVYLFRLPSEYTLRNRTWLREISRQELYDSGVAVVILSGDPEPAQPQDFERSMVLSQVFPGYARGKAGPEIRAYLVPSVARSPSEPEDTETVQP